MDSDSDGIGDADEIADAAPGGDTDGDGVPDHLDPTPIVDLVVDLQATRNGRTQPDEADTYSIGGRVTNRRSTPQSDVVLTLTLPDGLSFDLPPAGAAPDVGRRLSPQDCDVTLRRADCSIASIAAGESDSVSLLASGRAVNNGAVVALRASASGYEVSPADNNVTASLDSQVGTPAVASTSTTSIAIALPVDRPVGPPVVEAPAVEPQTSAPEVDASPDTDAREPLAFTGRAHGRIVIGALVLVLFGLLLLNFGLWQIGDQGNEP